MYRAASPYRRRSRLGQPHPSSSSVEFLSIGDVLIAGPLSCALGVERLSVFAIPVATATVPARTGIKNRAICREVNEAMAPITTGPTTNPAHPQPATAATALPVSTLFTSPAARRIIGTTHPS